MKRPDWIKCVADIHEDNKGLSWCGETLEGFHFIDIDHAAMNGRNEGRLVVCKLCRKHIIKALENGA